MAEKPSPLAKAAVGGLILGSGALLIYNLFFRPKPTVAVRSNPIRTIVLIDDKFEVETPKVVALAKGRHRFAVIPKSADLLIIYGFDRWTLNKQTVSYKPTMEVNITQPSVLSAHYMLVEAGIYPLLPT